jgi:hypothetical protein
VTGCTSLVTQGSIKARRSFVAITFKHTLKVAMECLQYRIGFDKSQEVRLLPEYRQATADALDHHGCTPACIAAPTEATSTG